MCEIKKAVLSGEVGTSGKVHPALCAVSPPRDAVGVVVEGIGTAELHHSDGRRLIYRFIQPGDIIGLVDAIPVRYSALLRLKVLYAPRRILSGLPEFDNVTLRETSRELQAMAEHAAMLAFCNAEEKFERAVVQLGDSFVSAGLPRQHAYTAALTRTSRGIAGILTDMAGVRLETGSRLKKRVACRLLE